MNRIERLAPWIIAAGAIMIAVGLCGVARIATKSGADLGQWRSTTEEALRIAKKWENVATNWQATAEEALRVGQMVQSNYMAHLDTHKPMPLETPFLMSTNFSGVSVIGWDPPLRLITADEGIHHFDYCEEGVAVLSLTADQNLLVHGELIGRILNCKFVPFQKP